ncbi:MAG: hypothetical protein JOY66_12280 [Acetobacteraceae bacterium]|nr:hypothetical protein [Acetobacteraceae bacterium]
MPRPFKGQAPTLCAGLRSVLGCLRAGPGGRAGPAGWPAATPGQRRVLLHAGLHKTGTTALQQFLCAAAERLRTQGVLYPATGRSRDWPDGHHNIAWQLAGDRRFNSSVGGLDEAAAEVAAFPGDAVLSSEGFESMLGVPARLAPLLEHRLLRDHAFTIVLWVREQASYIESLFFQMLRHGMAEDAVGFCASVVECSQLQYEDWVFHFDYEALRKGLLGLPARLAVRPYAGLAGGSTASDFLAFAGLAFGADPLEAKRANLRSDLAEAFSLFCQARLGGAGADWAARREAVAELFGGRQAHLSPRLRGALAARFAGGNRRLACACGFPAAALAIPPAPPADSVPIEALFSQGALDAVTGLAGGEAADPRAAFKDAARTLLRGSGAA